MGPQFWSYPVTVWLTSAAGDRDRGVLPSRRKPLRQGHRFLSIRPTQRPGVGHAPSAASAITAAVSENREASDSRVTPMTERFERIFQVSIVGDQALADITCERFLAPIFAIGLVYEDALPTLARLRDAGVQTAIVSNAPWGSPPEMSRATRTLTGVNRSGT